MIKFAYVDSAVEWVQVSAFLLLLSISIVVIAGIGLALSLFWTVYYLLKGDWDNVLR